MARKCTVCEVDIDPRRIAILPTTQTCTQHSTIEKKVAITVQMGEGDHTWIETYAVERDVFDKMQELEHGIKPEPKNIFSDLDDEDEVEEEDNEDDLNGLEELKGFKTWNEAPYGDNDEE